MQRMPRAVAWADRKYRAAERRDREQVELLCDTCPMTYRAKRADLRPLARQACEGCIRDGSARLP